MDITELGKKFGNAFLVVGLLMILLGFFLLASPAVFTKTAIIIIGIGFIICGILSFVAYAKIDGYIPGVGSIMLQGILDVLLGLIFVFSWETVAGSIPFLLGFWMLFNGVFRIPGAFTEKKLGSDNWWLTLLYGLLLIVCGYFFFSFPMISTLAAFTVLAIYLIAEGLSIFIGSFSIRKLCNSYKATDQIDY